MTQAQLHERLLSVQQKLCRMQVPPVVLETEDVARLTGVLRELDQEFTQLGESDPLTLNRQEVHRLIKVLNDFTKKAVFQNHCPDGQGCLRILNR